MTKFGETSFNFFDMLSKFLSSIYLLPILFLFTLIMKTLGLQEISIPIVALVVTLILLTCKNVQNIFAIVFYACFFIEDIFVNANWVIYGISIGLVCISFLYFVIKSVFFPWNGFKQVKEKFKNGKLYLPLAVASIGYLIGGILYNFTLSAFFITLGFCVVTPLLYYIALNHTQNLWNFMFKMFVLGGALVVAVLLVENAMMEESKNIFTRPIDFTIVGTQNINVAALFMFLGLMGCFGLGYKTKRDWFYMIGAALFTFAIVISLCRNVLLIVIVFLPVLTIVTIASSPKKINCLFSLCGIVIAYGVIYIVFSDEIQEVVSRLMAKLNFGDNGRVGLWKWCWQKFIENPVFGCGFISKEAIPTLRIPDVILAHNTILQWLCSLGIVGTLFLGWYYFTKYKIVFTDFFDKGMFLRLTIILIAFSGMFDQPAAMDIFIYLIITVSLAGLERIKLKLD